MLVLLDKWTVVAALQFGLLTAMRSPQPFNGVVDCGGRWEARGLDKSVIEH